jgi:hypothetical protein
LHKTKFKRKLPPANKIGLKPSFGENKDKKRKMDSRFYVEGCVMALIPYASMFKPAN